MRIALKIDVNTLKGMTEGVPKILSLLEEYKIRGTFLFTLGPDNSRKVLKQVYVPGFVNGLSDQSLAKQYGFKNRLTGLLTSSPDIFKSTQDIMRKVKDAGHEVGIHGWNHALWQKESAWKDAIWTRQEFSKSYHAFKEVMGEDATVYGAAGWQLNPSLLELEEEFNLLYASDTRGLCAYYPELKGVRSNCIQMPTTLPTLDELISGYDDVTVDNVHEALFDLSQKLLPNGQVYNLSAEVEGMHLIAVLEKLIVMWKGSSKEVGTLYDIVEDLDKDKIPTHHIGWGPVKGRSTHVAMQAKEVAS